MSKDIQMKSCPKCQAATETLLPIDADFRGSLIQAGNSNVPDSVCQKCYDQFAGQFSQGARLRMERDNREKNKLLLWKGRVGLVKQARSLMEQRAFSEAAVTYEKYLKTLEVVYNVKTGGLTPAVFNNSTRSKELTLLTSVYWDLLRIYDLSPKYGDRMAKTAQKLVLFLPFSTIYPDIIKHAESYLRQAKNPQIIKALLKTGKGGVSRCFIATAVFDSNTAPEVLILRGFRDRVLKKSTLGRQLTLIYYRFSPTLAGWLARRPHAKKIIACFLRKFAFSINKNLN